MNSSSSFVGLSSDCSTQPREDNPVTAASPIQNGARLFMPNAETRDIGAIPFPGRPMGFERNRADSQRRRFY